jgi:3-deoxy-manno-octulosonate cytidylyltransferase (CMP-KDO synthetase)
MIQWVHERVHAARVFDHVLVATDDLRIQTAVTAFGGDAVMTSPECASGTDRVAEAAEALGAEIIVNVQGDEPLIEPRSLAALTAALLRDPSIEISTLATPLRAAERGSADVVKVVLDASQDALYFSRSPIPYRREGQEEIGLRHIGVYGYRREALFRFTHLPVSPLERCEGLEQLRALDHGMRIRVAIVDDEAGVGVDTQQDLDRVRRLLASIHTRGG